MIGEQRRLRRFRQLRGRVAVGARAALFEHDVALRQNVLVGKHEPRHAVGFELHHRWEMLARDALEIGGVVL
jgi:hypothetical protein